MSTLADMSTANNYLFRLREYSACDLRIFPYDKNISVRIKCSAIVSVPIMLKVNASEIVTVLFPGHKLYVEIYQGLQNVSSNRVKRRKQYHRIRCVGTMTM